MEKEGDFFVGIYEPIDVRRNLLESSKEVVKSLQAHERIGQIRKGKIIMYKEMKRIMAELDVLVSRLKKNLPKSHVRKAISLAKKQASVHVEEKDPELAQQLRKLEEQLRDIEKDISK